MFGFGRKKHGKKSSNKIFTIFNYMFRRWQFLICGALIRANSRILAVTTPQCTLFYRRHSAHFSLNTK
jgi:hypothetical protein